MAVHKLAVFILSLLAVSAFALEKYVIVKQSDFAGEESYSVMTSSEFKDLDREFRKEGFMATKAKMMAAKAWAEDESNEGTRFPSSAIKRRKAKVVGRTYKSEMDADDKLMEIEERLMEKEADEEKREEKREEDREDAYKERYTSKGPGSKGQSAIDRQRLNRALTRREEEKLRLEAIAYEREEMNERAREVYEEQIELLKAPPEDEEDEEDEDEEEDDENGDH